MARSDPPMHPAFSYEEAFARNIGWLTRQEQQALRAKRVAIAGLGGVGGSHLLTLVRLGVGRFHLADPDRFELANFNRQAGAELATVGRLKVEVMAERARAINPELELRLFPEGVQAGNLDAFLQDVDLYLDGLDFFVLETRRRVFAACERLGIPAVTAAPLGMGAALLCFVPGGMGFEDYFRLEGHPEEEQLLRFLVGLAPAALHRTYLVDPSSVDLARHRGPSTAMACELCAGLAATQALKLLLGRGPVPAAPRGLQLDAYRNRLAVTWRPGGNRHPLQRLALRLARRQLRRPAPAPPPSPPDGPMERVLEAARWAPSGDNAQPWRFRILGERRVLVHARDTRDLCVYDLDGRATHLALGTLLETLAIAAAAEGLRARWRPVPQEDPRELAYEVELGEDGGGGGGDPALAPYIPLRATCRGPLSTRPLTLRERQAIEAAVEPYRLLWWEGRAKARMAALLWRNGLLRLGLPEAYAAHREAVRWGERHSRRGIPEHALGLDPLTRRVMRWAMGSRRRALTLARLGGGWLPALEMDLLPALRCAAHFALLAPEPPAGPEEQVEAGRAVQRLWLTATRLGLRVQPEYTPLVFARYLVDGLPFTRDAASRRRAEAVASRLRDLLGGTEALARAVFLGRIGAGEPPPSRSLRLSLEELVERRET